MSTGSLRADDLEVIKRNSDMVYRMAYSLVKSRYDAEDIHQEVFIKYINRKPVFVEDSHEKAWFLRVTINMCKNLWKTVWRQRVVSIDDDENSSNIGFVDTIEDKEKNGELIANIKKLPKNQRAVIHLFYYEELSINEIATIMGSNPSTVRTWLTRARARLKDLVKEN